MSLFKSPTASPRTKSRSASSTSSSSGFANSAAGGFSSSLTARPPLPNAASSAGGSAGGVGTYRSLVFNGSIPIQITVIGGKESGEVLYVMGNRVGYLALVKEEVRKMLGMEGESEDGEEKGGWFEYAGKPLRCTWARIS
ncbi:hypothetical protein BT69DRAFT_1301190 [Atractiella rhizophila]|nr:hypothetical protein BT69DRAFT_1301190 [Atractiella rhizophila]